MKIAGHIVDVLKGEIFDGFIEIEGEKIVNIGLSENVPDVYVMPGFVDAHVHIESSMLVPSRFAELAVRNGTVATVSDPHEIANVLGIAGVDFMINDAKKTPLKIYFGAPSCVPATDFETSGAVLDSGDVFSLLKRKDIYYLSEMMNFPGVIFNDKEVLAKIKYSKDLGKPIDGHAPNLSGVDLEKYAEAGITTDHESSTEKEAEEKIKLGIKLQIREGSAAKNFESLYPLIDKYPDKVMLCSDDSHPDDLQKGHINRLFKRALSKKLDLFNILKSCNVNAVNHYGLNVGLLQKNDPADFIIVDNLEDVNIMKTYINGQLVYEKGRGVLFSKLDDMSVLNNFKAEKISETDLKLSALSSKIKVMKAEDGDLLTTSFVADAKIIDNKVFSDIENDILKIVVINRYVKNAKPQVAFIKGFGFKKGAIASSVAHDSHNIIAVGTSDSDIVNAVNMLIENKGGLAVYSNEFSESLKLEVAGLMSNENADFVAEKYEKINALSKGLGSRLQNPFMTMSFMALLVIPELKIGDKGLFDGSVFQKTDLFVS